MDILKRKFTDYFDKIYVLNLVNRTDRRKFVENEFKAIGIYDELIETGKLEWVESVKLPITQKALDCMYESGDIDFCYADRSQKIGQFMCASEHYRMLKRSLIKGYNRVLILEDDVCFMKNFSYIMKALEQAPDDFNVLHLEGFYWPENDDDKAVYLSQMSENIEDGHWVPSERFKLWCTAALIYSREGMEEYCSRQEQKFISPDHPLFWMTDKCYAYSYPLIVQESKQELVSDITNYGTTGIEAVNVYLTYCDFWNEYYHNKDFKEIIPL